MKLQIYSVRDIKTDQYMNPQYTLSTGAAIRGFADEINRKDENNFLHKHPGDFELYHLGEFDTATGLFSTGTPKSVALGDQLVIK